MVDFQKVRGRKLERVPYTLGSFAILFGHDSREAQKGRIETCSIETCSLPGLIDSIEQVGGDCFFPHIVEVARTRTAPPDDAPRMIRDGGERIGSATVDSEDVAFHRPSVLTKALSTLAGVEPSLTSR